jgi:hypothetical protein
MVEREAPSAHTRSYLLRVDVARRNTRYLVCDLRSGECWRFTSAVALQRFLAVLRRSSRLQ